MIFLNAVAVVNAQQPLPGFSLENKTIYVPAFLPGIMKDPTAILRNDTLIYTLKSQLFPNGLQVKSGKVFKSPANPWQALYEMTDAFSKMDKKRIIALYNSASKEKISSLLSGDKGMAFLDFVNKATHSGLWILGGLQYQNGFLAFTKDSLFGLHENYIVPENNQYKLATLDDNSPTGWNIGLYLKYNPRPMMTVQHLSMPDSLSINDSIAVRISLAEHGRWISIYLPVPGTAVSMLVQDNGVNDNDPTPGVISFELKGRIFISPGSYSFYISSFNFPVQRVSSNFISEVAGYSIRIK